jgi:hypothetical protein
VQLAAFIVTETAISSALLYKAIALAESLVYLFRRRLKKKFVQDLSKPTISVAI